MAQKLTILGSTGSIGTQALDVVDKRGYEVVALTASTNVAEIEKQIRQYKPKLAAMADEKAASELKIALADTEVKVYSGESGICEMIADCGADTVLNSVVGKAGLMPTIATLNEGKKIGRAHV